MEAKYPAWTKEHHVAAIRAEFEPAVSSCDGPLMGGFEVWLDDFEEGYCQSGAKDQEKIQGSDILTACCKFLFGLCTFILF
jgi:hypothetical protein